MADQQMGGLMDAGVAADPMASAQGAMSPQPQQPQQAPQQGGQVDIQPILDGIDVPPGLKPMYDKIVLSGMRIMFEKGSHKLLVDQLQKEGPLAEKISAGIVALMYMLWTGSNKSIAPQLIIPATVALTARAFDYVQKTGDPEATKEVLGQAIEGSLDGVMKGFGSKLDDVENTLQQSKQGISTAADAAQSMGMQPQGGGLMDATGGANG